MSRGSGVRSSASRTPRCSSGRGRFIDDLGVQPGTLHATILRSPHAHADILSIDVEAAKRLPGVAAVLTGSDVKAVTTSLVVGVKAPVECWPIAIGPRALCRRTGRCGRRD